MSTQMTLGLSSQRQSLCATQFYLRTQKSGFSEKPDFLI